MIKHILIPIDLDHAERTGAMLESVKQLIKPVGVAITLLHVLPDVPRYVAIQIPTDLQKKVTVDARDELEALARRYDLTGAVQFRIRTGKAYQSILEIAKEEQVDLIVIGSHEPDIADYLLGSVASKVVRHAKCSVMVVR